MSDYRAPTKEISFVLNRLVEIDRLTAHPDYEEATPEMIAVILEEAARLTGGVVAPTNQMADQQGTRLENNVVAIPDGLGDVYRQLVEGGWIGLPFAREWGGEALPEVLASSVLEMLISANLGFSLCPMLTTGAIKAMEEHASDILKKTYLPRMVSGEWSGTMNLTEPQAGTDLAAVRTKATANGNHYLIKGQKVFITWGDHDMTDNIVHLVLARLPEAPAGVSGISLFLVPKYLVDESGALGERNDVYAVSLEHKLGIRSSPTCTMNFGENGGAVGYLVGEPNNGLACMFTMMNHARLTVGLQGVGLSERALQKAVAYAQERIQGPSLHTAGSAPIIHHPDVRRMLMLMKSLTEASRALAYAAIGSSDYAQSSASEDERRAHRRRADLLTPVVKGWCTEVAQEITSLAVQVHGGMGYIEETGVAQYYRDARILPIYEGTNGIQALDLIRRKYLHDGGEAMNALVREIGDLVDELAECELVECQELYTIGKCLDKALEQLKRANMWIVSNADANGMESASVAFNYLMLVGTVAGGWLLAKGALAASTLRNEDVSNKDFYAAKIVTARFYFEHVAPRLEGYLQTIQAGSSSLMALHEEHFCL